MSIRAEAEGARQAVDRVLVVVPRTAPALYGYLKEKFADDPTISVILDRRVRPRGKRAVERRKADRRDGSRPTAMIVPQGGKRGR